MELPKIWDLEVLDIKDPVERKNKTLLEEETLIHFKETIKVGEDRRYEVSLPWLAGHPPVYDMYDVAESRLRSVTKCLLKENIYEVYDDILRKWQKEEYASLNECLSVGPSLSEQISPLLLRFRTGAWNTEDKSKLEFFRHCRVVFGVTSSPFLLNASIRHHLNSAEFQLESLQQTIEKHKKGFYVDNLTISVENQEELVKFKTQTMEIMTAATFELRCWAHTGVQDQERMLHGTFKQATLHIFTNASAIGYACCAFLQCVEEEVKVSLVSAKARVAPVQRPTIPQLELLGATIGARIASIVLETLNSTLKTYFWTDSMTVLGWITNSELWNTFVGNRVREIRELTNVEDWRFVPGDLNPADLPSHSCDWSQLFWSQWWEGPKWLYEIPECWPHTEITLPQEALLERRKSVAVNLTMDTNDNFGNRFLYFSSYPKIIYMTAWVLRFCHNLKANSHKLRKELTFQEIQMAEEAVI
ncbi:ethanolamine-phosphate cytidylyltransferase [Trichonephila clavipes]|nr:ethanolamine-phosphate cytidylyltransferase [Trichonephila clavipes]